MISMNAIISARIVAAMATGLAINEAIDAVLGAGTTDQLVSDLYDAARAKSEG